MSTVEDRKMLITDYLEKNAETWPEDGALVELNYLVKTKNPLEWRQQSWNKAELLEPFRREITWEVFNEKANRIANFLISRGVGKGDHVALIMKNCLEWMPLYFGILKTGAVAVMLSYRFQGEMILNCVELADVNVFLFGPEIVDRIEEIKERLFDRRMGFFIGVNCPAYSHVPCPEYVENIILESDNCSSRNPAVDIQESDPAAVYFSSGTTGDPKAVLLSHASLVFSAQVEQAHHYQTKDDCFLCIPPFYHEGATIHWFGSLITGSSAVLLKGIKPDMILEAVSREKCTIAWLLVPWAQDILDALDRQSIRLSDYPNMKQWRLMHIGAQPVPIATIRRWKEYFPEQQYETSYGLSESGGPGCVHTGIGNECEAGAIGIPGYGWECRVVDSERREVPVNTTGELAVRGPGVMMRYYKNPEATREVLTEDGWLYTGDMVVKKDDGQLYIVDRKKDVIISGGENIYPVPIEDFIHNFEPVRDVAIIGFPHDRLGEVPGAIIQLKEGYSCTKEDVRAYCGQLPRYERPVQIFFGDVPRGSTGKIKKQELRRKYGVENTVCSTQQGDGRMKL